MQQGFQKSKQASQMLQFSCPRWAQLPGIELTGYLNEVFAPLCPPGEEKILTKAMVNNYVKQKVMAPPTKKKYGRAHVAQLLAICALKQVLSIQEVAQLIRIQTQICEVQRAYDYFCGQLEEALKQTVQGKLENSGASEEQLLVIHATRAYASKVYLQKLLEFENTKASRPPKTPRIIPKQGIGPFFISEKIQRLRRSERGPKQSQADTARLLKRPDWPPFGALWRSRSPSTAPQILSFPSSI